MQRRYLIALALSVAFVAFYLVAGSRGEMPAISSDILFVVVSGTCALLGFLVIKRWGTTGRLGTARLGIFLGVVMWFLGELTWTLYEIALQISIPYPSLADAFYLAGYLPMTVGTFQLLLVFRDLITRSRILFSAFLGALVVGLTSLLLLEPLITNSTDLITMILDLAYPTLDVIVLIPCLFMAVIFRGGVMAGSWRWISLGIALNVVADILFSHGTLTGWYFSGHPIELFYLWGYVSLGLGFQAQRTEL